MEMIRHILAGFFFLANIGLAPGDPPDINSTSPDQLWKISAHWVNSGSSREGYSWDLQNIKTKKVYFDHAVQKDEALPHRFNVLWSPNSHYAALNLYYGRAVQGVAVIPVTLAKPELVIPIEGDSKIPVENTLIKADDLDN